MPSSPRAATLLAVVLLILAGALRPSASVAQATSETVAPETVPDASSAAASLRALQHENDSLQAVLDASRASALEDAGATAQPMGLRVFWAVVMLLLVVGFAAQDLLKNLFGGLVVVFDSPFQIGDMISVGGTYGEVTAIGLRATRLTTPDDHRVSVPNAQMVDGQVANANAGAPDGQVVTDLYLPGWIDEAQAKKIAYEAAANSRYVFLQKPIVVLVRDAFKETFLTHLKVKAYVLDTRHAFLMRSDITERARRAFREQGLLPTYDARAYAHLSHIDKTDPPPTTSPDRASSHSAGEPE